MIRIALSLGALIAMLGAAIAEDAGDAKQDTILVHGKAITLSCAEWRQNPDSSWTSNGSLLVGTETVSSVTLRGPNEVSALMSKCDTGSALPVKPQGDASPRHAKHKHHPADQSDGS